MNTSLPVPTFAVQFAAGKWFAIAPCRRVHNAGQSVELRDDIGQSAFARTRPAARTTRRLALVGVTRR